MKIRATVWTLIFVFALFVSVPVQPQTVKKDELVAKAENVVHPVVSKRPEPEPPGDYRGPEVNVTIVLKAIFRSSGKVTDIHLAKVIPEETPRKLSEELTKRCIKAAKQIKFIPATKDGYKVSMYMQLEYTIHLD